MKQSDKKTFYDSFKNLSNVTTSVVGKYPFEWHVKQYGNLIAKAVDRLSGNSEDDYVVTDFFIKN